MCTPKYSICLGVERAAESRTGCDCLVPKPGAQASLGALRSPLLSACWAGVMGEERVGLSLGPGQLPPLSLIEHSFPWDLEAASWGPFESGGLTAAVLGHPLGAKRNLSTLIKLSLKATASPGMLAHSTFSKFFIIPPRIGQQTFWFSRHPCLQSFRQSTSISLWGATHSQSPWFKGGDKTQAGPSES